MRTHRSTVVFDSASPKPKPPQLHDAAKYLAQAKLRIEQVRRPDRQSDYRLRALSEALSRLVAWLEQELP